jgi:hypothetical protein
MLFLAGALLCQRNMLGSVRSTLGGRYVCAVAASIADRVRLESFASVADWSESSTQTSAAK